MTIIIDFENKFVKGNCCGLRGFKEQMKELQELIKNATRNFMRK